MSLMILISFQKLNMKFSKKKVGNVCHKFSLWLIFQRTSSWYLPGFFLKGKAFVLSNNIESVPTIDAMENIDHRKISIGNPKVIEFLRLLASRLFLGYVHNTFLVPQTTSLISSKTNEKKEASSVLSFGSFLKP